METDFVSSWDDIEDCNILTPTLMKIKDEGFEYTLRAKVSRYNKFYMIYTFILSSNSPFLGNYFCTIKLI